MADGVRLAPAGDAGSRSARAVAVCETGYRLRALVAGGAGLTYLHPLLVFFLAMAAWGFFRRRQVLIAIGLIGIFLVAWPPVAWLAVQPLAAWYSPRPPAAPGAEAIVVLSGGFFPVKGAERQASMKQDTYLRCRHAVWVWKQNSRLPVVVAGGRFQGVPTSA